MPQLFFNQRLMQGIVIVAHLIIVLLFIAFVNSFDESTINRIRDIPPVQNSYTGVGLGWIGIGRDIFHGLAFVCGTLLGSKLCFYGMDRKHGVSRFFIVTLSIQILFGAALNLVLVGLVWFGGVWHLMSLLLIGLEAMSFVVMTAIMLTNWETFKVLSEIQDKITPDVIDTDLLEK